MKHRINDASFENGYTTSNKFQRDQSSFSDETEGILTDLIAILPLKVRPRHKTGFLGLFGPSVDSLSYYLEQFGRWNLEVQSLRRNPEASSPSSVGFVTFDTPTAAVHFYFMILNRYLHLRS
jgi:hypothetical protein